MIFIKEDGFVLLSLIIVMPLVYGLILLALSTSTSNLNNARILSYEEDEDRVFFDIVRELKNMDGNLDKVEDSYYDLDLNSIKINFMENTTVSIEEEFVENDNKYKIQLDKKDLGENLWDVNCIFERKNLIKKTGTREEISFYIIK